MSTTNVLVIGLVTVTTASTGCATTTPYISNELGAQIAATPSPFHKFTYVRVDEDDGELVVYGKLRHNHVTCDREGHVDLVVEDAGQNTIYTASLPMRRQSNKRRGWYGAGFRTRIYVGSQASTVRLAFHDPGCHGASFDCGSNVATAENTGAR
ncbi:MAG: hypothetical protein JRH20_09030 [Deltaproteobacteria bacterium]|nr:hypothetical protein [Deltaproteobacteria bacterium]